MTDSVIFHAASYRDPSGFIFTKNGTLYRQVNQEYREHFDHFTRSGCYEKLVKNNLLLPHAVLDENLTGSVNWYQTLKPEEIEFITYPYEWSFSMLKDAALLTLQILKEAISFGMILKDATPLNVQWFRGQFIFIDTLSFEKFDETPWIAYRQFCETFLSPLLLMHYSKKPLEHLQLSFPEGIPLEITSSLLPSKSKFSLQSYLHIHLHSKVSSNHAGEKQKKVKFSKQKLLNLVYGMESMIQKLKIPKTKSIWSSYYTEAAGREDYLGQKKKIISEWLSEMKDVTKAMDLGSNNGEFSKLIAAAGIHTIAADADPYCIDELYSEIKKNRIENIQPLILDLANPSPSSGVNNRERSSFLERSAPGLAIALALIHHLAIGKNIPFPPMATLFSQLLKNPGSKLIIEFVPKEDEKVKLLLQNRRDIFNNYNEMEFLNAFKKHFVVLKEFAIPGSERILFLMERVIQ
ncbi:MAG: hypothetical protein B6D37_00580 [Sphingobacteriales bacterium UTBCD1]|jgi:hypothetical protein|nr:MAG: hypothetical protein B6D37_00580 [Sphingobacteriales bacterium UTBCD1]